MRLDGKSIVLGVTGAISAYKALDLLRLLVKDKATVYPVMTRSACEFVAPLSFGVIAKRPVSLNLFAPAEAGGISHIELAQKSDLIVVAPATANIIGKAANGIADDLLSTLIMAASAPVLFAPSMNTKMWESAAVRENVGKLRSRGALFVGPVAGELACGDTGMGRLACPQEILEATLDALSHKDMAKEKVLVSAGPTREQIDPIRYVSNASSGKMGYAIARGARMRGAEVVLVTGPSSLSVPPGVIVERVQSAEQMHDACARYFEQSTLVVMAAAVADYRPIKAHASKIKKEAGGERLSIEMERTQDVLKHMGKKKKKQLLVGFALETDDMEQNARKKLEDKNLDLVVANGPVALDSEVNRILMIDRAGRAEELGPASKDELAHRILDAAMELKKRR